MPGRRAYKVVHCPIPPAGVFRGSGGQRAARCEGGYQGEGTMKARPYPLPCRGAAAVELAISLPLVLLLLLGGIEYALQFSVLNEMTNAARNAAREMVIRGGTQAAACAAAQKELSYDSSKFTITFPPPAADSPQDVIVHISTLRSNFSLGIGGLLDFFNSAHADAAQTIDAEATMRKEQ